MIAANVSNARATCVDLVGASDMFVAVSIAKPAKASRYATDAPYAHNDFFI